VFVEGGKFGNRRKYKENNKSSNILATGHGGL
jgi:hypothetical protein